MRNTTRRFCDSTALGRCGRARQSTRTVPRLTKAAGSGGRARAGLASCRAVPIAFSIREYNRAGTLFIFFGVMDLFFANVVTSVLPGRRANAKWETTNEISAVCPNCYRSGGFAWHSSRSPNFPVVRATWQRWSKELRLCQLRSVYGDRERTRVLRTKS
jgi:hypothetical protein